MPDSGLCPFCGTEIGTGSWSSCPECGEDFDEDLDDDLDEDDDEDDEDDDDEDDD